MVDLLDAIAAVGRSFLQREARAFELGDGEPIVTDEHHIKRRATTKRTDANRTELETRHGMFIRLRPRRA